MPDYIYLLENRLSADQQNALRQISHAAGEAGMNVFLVGGAVRDLTSGSSVRDLDVAVQGNALKLKKTLERSGATLWGEQETSHTLFFRFPVGVRVEISSTRREEYPKPGKPVYHWDSIHEDLRRRDFTANAMALSLNERSYGLLMDPLNGVADIESRHLRLVSNYGFLEEPARLLRATRLASRLGWDLEERTKTRYQTAKDEGAIASLSDYQKGYELEEIGHEEDGLRALSAMENEGWMHHLDPAWTVSKADHSGLEEMHRLLTQLQVLGVYPDASAASMQLLTAKLQPKDLAALKKTFVRSGFVEEWNHLDAAAKEFAKQLLGKETATPSATWKLFTSANPQAVLWLGLTSKSAPVQAKYSNFFTVWPEARQRIPHALMQELRITQDLPGYAELLHQLFLQTIDGKLETEEQLRAFLEPYSPPAPPPPVTVRRTRASRKGEPKVKEPVSSDDEEDEIESDEDRTEDAAEEETDDGLKRADDDESVVEKNSPAAKQTKPAAKAETQPKAGAGKVEPAAAKRASVPEPTSLKKQPSIPAHAAPAPAKTDKAHPAAKPAKSHPAPAPVAPAGKKSAAVKAKAKIVSRPAPKAAPKKAAAKKSGSGKPAAAVKTHKKTAPAKKAKPAKKK